MEKLTQLFQSQGLSALIYVLFVIVGAGMWLNVLWGLLSGGPKAITEPGAPYLYDRLYFMLWLLATIGWTMSLLSALAGFSQRENAVRFEGFLFGWSLLAIGMSLIFHLRLHMMLHAARYLAVHGFWLFRPLHWIQLRQFDHEKNLVLKFVPFIFLIVGTAVLLFSLLHVGEAWRQTVAGAQILLSYMTS
jgi:hypothetical protein